MIGSDIRLIAALQALMNESIEDKQAAAWQVFAQATCVEELAVALDFALDHDLVDTTLLPLLRGDDAPAQEQTWINPIDGTELVWIPPGQFNAGFEGQVMRSRGFFLARHPITNQQFQTFLAATNYRPVDDPQPETFLAHWRHGFNQAHKPVVWVSLVDVMAYCAWAGLMLPTEWLWERAARGTVRPALRARDELVHLNCEQLIAHVSQWCWPVDEIPLSTLAEQVLPRWEDLPPIDPQAPVRGRHFKRRSRPNSPAAYRCRLSVYRRSDWVGFRPAFYPLAHRV